MQSSGHVLPLSVQRSESEDDDENGYNHYQEPPRSDRRRVHLVEESESEDEGWVLSIDECNSIQSSSQPSKIYASMTINSQETRFQLDSGATVNVLPLKTYVEISADKDLKELKPPNTTLVMFNKSKLQPLNTE